MIEQILGWIGNICFILGAIYLARKKKYGFSVQILANMLYLLQSLLMHNISLCCISN